MLKHREVTLDKIKRIIKTNGIPAYYSKWSIPGLHAKKSLDELSDETFIQYLQAFVKAYHPHSSIMVTYNTTNENNTKITRDITNHKQSPKLTYDEKHKIGTICFFEYYLDLNDDYDKDPSFISITTTVNNTISKWLANGMAGLVIDLRKHTGGWYFPFVKSLHAILDGKTLFGWSNSHLLPTERKWISYINGKISYQTKQIQSHYVSSIPIAIIIGEHTYSSGEFCASIFYRGDSNIRVFGANTGGGLSVNQTFSISKYIHLNIPTKLTTTVDGKFHDQQYLKPDTYTARPVTDAKTWLLSKMK